MVFDGLEDFILICGLRCGNGEMRVSWGRLYGKGYGVFLFGIFSISMVWKGRGFSLEVCVRIW